MKKVIFICLLSLSMCLSRPEDQAGAPAQPGAANVPTNAKPLPPKAEAPQSPAPTHIDLPENATKTVPAAPVNNSTVPPKDANNATSPTTPGNKANDTKTDTADNKTNTDKKTDAPAGKDGNKVDPGKDANAADSNNKPDNGSVTSSTMPDSKNGKETPTTTHKPEETTKVAPTEKIVQARGFDGPSFIGGIILTLGLLAIGFMGFKYYKNQTERNYHTL